MRLSYWSSDVCSSDLRVIAALKHLPGVRAVGRVQDAELEAALRPWLGSELMEGDLPIPALIDVDLISGGGASHMTSLRNAVTAIAPSAKVEPHGAFLAPLSQLMRELTWLALGLVLLMTLAPAAIRSEAQKSALQSLISISYAVFCLTQK